MKKSRFLLLLLALMVSMAASAQGILGTVIDENGEAIIGASVVEKGNPNNGTATNIDGQFTLNVKPGTPIVISYIGYATQELPASNNMTVTLKEDTQALDWSLYPGVWEEDFVQGNLYNFHAIVRYVESTKAGVAEGDYMVFPLEGGDDVITGIENVETRGEVASITYVNMMGVESTTPFKGVNIVVTRYTTGETVVTKQLR